MKIITFEDGETFARAITAVLADLGLTPPKEAFRLADLSSAEIGFVRSDSVATVDHVPADLLAGLQQLAEESHTWLDRLAARDKVPDSLLPEETP